LFAAKEQYLYYRTEPRLTALGGYYVYLALGDSLGFLPYDLDKFKISHTDESVTGSLYKRVNNKNFPQDVVSRYEFTQYDCFSVVHKNALAGKKYYSLFPREIESLIDPFELSLGGYSPIMEIVNPMGEKSSLLVLGDEAGTSYLPFLALNYNSITFLDLTRLSVEELLEFKDDSFTNVLFCYSADNFLNKKLPSHGMLLSENK
ncbi:MAG: DHHW family protein, partial [Oscillospiraceae bacterium]